MTSSELAAACGVSQRQIYNLKTRFPKDVPASFNDLAGWKKVVEAHRVVMATKRHAPRSDPGIQSDNARYVAARARRTESQAEAEAIRLAVTKRNFIDRAEVEGAFAVCARLVSAYLRRLAGDAPCALSGRTEAEIDAWMQEAIRRPLESVKLDPAFFEPKKGQS